MEEFLFIHKYLRECIWKEFLITPRIYNPKIKLAIKIAQIFHKS